LESVVGTPLSHSSGDVLTLDRFRPRLRELGSQRVTLQILDELITGFGRVGAAFASQRWGVTPDRMTVAKGLTNGAIPMGAVLLDGELQEALMQGPEGQIEFFHEIGRASCRERV